MRYPGGTVLDESSRGYSFSQNFLSDLGGTVAFNGERNVGGAVLMGAAIIIGVVVLAGALVGTIRFLSSSPRARIFARLAAVAGALVCVGYLGVALAPIDRAWTLHRLSTLVASHAFPVATALLGIATRRDGRFRTRAMTGWVTLTLVLAGFIAVAYLGPDVSTQFGLVTRVLAQKIMAATVLVVLWLESREVEIAGSRAL